MACSSEGLDVQEQKQRSVSFDTYTARFLTRGGDAGTTRTAVDAIPNGRSIGVYAYYHDDSFWFTKAGFNEPNFMWNQQVTYREDFGVFDYTPVKYWPNEESDKVSFIAYYPHTPMDDGVPIDLATSPTGVLPQLDIYDVGLPTFLFAVKDNVAEQEDFMVSDLITDLPVSRAIDDDPNEPFNNLTVYDKVRFVFHHALSMVEFRVVADDDIAADLVEFQVNSLTVTDIKSCGLLKTLYNNPVTSLRWEVQYVPHTYHFQLSEPQLLLPQTLVDEAMLTLDYKLKFKNNSSVYQYKDGTLVDMGGGKFDDYPVLDLDGLKGGYTYANTASVQLNTLKNTATGLPLTEWQYNHRYIYTIRLRANRIEFTGTVVEWGDTDDMPYDEYDISSE